MNEKRYIILKGSGGAGIGDKIRSLAVAILYARLSGRTLVVDWDDTAYGRKIGNYFDALFQLRGVASEMEMPSVSTVAPPAWQGRLHCSFNEVRALDGCALDGSDWNRGEAIQKYSFDIGCLDCAEDAVVLWDFDQIAKLRPHFTKLFPDEFRLDDDTIFGLTLRRHVGFADDISARVDHFANAHFHSEPILGMHVRLTSEARRIRTTPTDNEYIRFAQKVLRSTEAGKLFLATDNKMMLERFGETFGWQRVLAIEKWFPESGESLHKQARCPDPLACARDALCDILLLARCTYLAVLGNSSFSMVARYFSRAPGANIHVLSPSTPLWLKVLMLARRFLTH